MSFPPPLLHPITDCSCPASGISRSSGIDRRWEGGGFIRGVRKRWVRGQGGCKTRVGRGGWVMRGIFSHFSFHVLFSSLRYQCFSRNIPGPPDCRDSGPEPQQQQGGRCSPLSSGRQNERCLSVLTPGLCKRGQTQRCTSRISPSRLEWRRQLFSSPLSLSGPVPSCPGWLSRIIIWR